MDYEWNEQKRARNASKHGVDFAEAHEFNWETAIIVSDYRRDYGEERLRAFGSIRGRLHVLAFTRRGGLVRIISLRKANHREVKFYGEKKNP